ncbi:MAG: hypothetical protein MAG451_02215 [Anaerolineales bacterium]|nr:hypothetical protein [Anaerolineales bacterium]
MPETHRNQFLFSNRYLNCHLPKRPEWQENDAERALREVTAIWERFTPRAGDAAHTESKWVRPVLHALGYTLPAGRSTLETGQGTPPAYTLHAGGPQDASAVIHIRSWDRRLDQPSPVAQDSRQLGRNVNPAFEMRAHMAQAGLRWGILTNGRLWRLYHRDTAGRLDVYYEVNLPALIELGSWGAGGLGGGGAVGRC